MSDKECPHVRLVRQNVGNQRWYKCLVCPQKFHAAEWDGKVTVAAPTEVSNTDWENLRPDGTRHRSGSKR